MGLIFFNLRPFCKGFLLSASNHMLHNCSLGRFVSPISFHFRNPSHILSNEPIYVTPFAVHFHAHHHHRGEQSTGQEGEKVFRLGLAADLGLATGKALTGYLSGSTAIIADAAHSVSDVVLSGIALLSFKVARAPKDKEYPYGHGKFETLGAVVISCMLLATAGGITWHALDILLGMLSTTAEHVPSHSHSRHQHGIDVNHPVLALNMTILSICVKEGLYWLTRRAGERADSGLMKANAWHHRVDAISSMIALIGVGGSILGQRFLDPVAGFIVSGMILKAAFETGYQSVMELVDAAVPSQSLEPIRQTILQVEEIKGCHRLRGRKAGSSLYLDVHIEVDPFSSVSAAHAVGEKVRKHIHASHLGVAEVFIHIDPWVPQYSQNKEEHLMKDVDPMHKDVEETVSRIISSKISEHMAVERMTHHLLQGKNLLQVEVSMPPETSIREVCDSLHGIKGTGRTCVTLEAVMATRPI